MTGALLTASERLVFVGSVVAVVVSVAQPPAADAAPVAAGELVAVARPVGMRADGRRLVASVSAVVFAVAVPPSRNTPVCRLAAEIVCKTTPASNRHSVSIRFISFPSVL